MSPLILSCVHSVFVRQHQYNLKQLVLFKWSVTQMLDNLTSDTELTLRYNLCYTS